MQVETLGRTPRRAHTQPASALAPACSATDPSASRCQPAGRRLGPFWRLALALVFAVGCSPEARPPGAATPLVASSVPPFQWLVDELAGDWVESISVLPAGASPAGYTPTLAQRQRLARADLYLRVGHRAFPFEGAWLDGLLADRPDLPVIDAASLVALRPGDPHLWLDPANMRALAGRLAAVLAERWPERAEPLAERKRALDAKLAAVTGQVALQLAPHRGRAFFVFHPAWGYFAATFGLEQVAIEADHKAPSVAQLGRLAERARAAGVRVIYLEPQFDGSAARSVAEAIGARVERLDPLAYQWDENLRAVARTLSEGMSP